MKRYIITVLMLLIALLTGCANQRNITTRGNLIQENWMRAVPYDPNPWANGSSRWFKTGDASATQIANEYSPDSAAISTMAVRVPDFTTIKVNGSFQVQIVGCETNALYLNGPNKAVRAVVVEVHNGTLYLHQAKDAPRDIGRVIVRINVRSLNNLVQMGCGTIEGVNIRSWGLCIHSTKTATGNIYLGGSVCLQRVIVDGRGCVNVFGANTDDLRITTHGSGNVNIAGNRVGVRTITHHGSSNINIINATSSSLVIFADGCGRIGIRGMVNLHQVQATDKTCVFIYGVNSDVIYARAYNRGRIGLAGCVRNLSVETANSARFEGRSLCAQDAYVRARDASHINISASNKIFASATQNSSVYFFGSPNLMSQFISGNGVIIPIWGNEPNACYLPTRAIYKDEVVYKDEPPHRAITHPYREYHWQHGRMVRS